MAQYDISTQVNEIKALGTTIADLEAKFGDRIDVNENRAYVWNRASLEAFETYAEEVRRNAEIAAGARVEFRKHNGAWILWGAGLTTGQVVTVSKKDGSTTQETVGDIVATSGGMVGAKVGPKPLPEAPAPALAPAETSSPYVGLLSRGTVEEIRASLVRALGADADVYDITAIMSELYIPFARGRLLALDVDRSEIAGIIDNHLAG